MVDIILYISIHSLRMEGDADAVFIFQEYSISIHSLRMEGDFTGVTPEMECEISIHSLRMEGDPSTLIYTVLLSIFQSTPSAWRETVFRFQEFCKLVISIHSLRMEGDHWGCFWIWGWEISIHSLRMEGDKQGLL